LLLAPEITLNLRQASARLLELLELDVLAQQVVGDLSVHFNSGHCLLFIHNPERHELELLTPKAWYKGLRGFPIGQGLAGCVAASRSVLSLGAEATEVWARYVTSSVLSQPTPMQHADFNLELDAEPDVRTESILVVPILHNDTLVGTFH
jgi:GAF domain-containing protein